MKGFTLESFNIKDDIGYGLCGNCKNIKTIEEVWYDDEYLGKKTTTAEVCKSLNFILQPVPEKDQVKECKFYQPEPSIDDTIKELRGLTDNFLFIEYYTHTNENMYKILNQYTTYKEEKFVLGSMNEGIERSLDLAIEEITKCKKEYYK